jgi:LacI family transcriptional regulator
MRRAVEHLLQLGHRRVGLLLNGDTASSVTERQEGYKRALHAAGIDANQMPVGRFDPLPGESESACIQRALSPLISGAQACTAIVAVNDITAIAALEGLEARGIRVPEDMSLVGFDGLLRWVPGGGQLTSPSQDFFRYGELAAELLLERIADNDPQRPRRHVLLDAPLVIKSSTAPVSPTTGPTLGLENKQ